MAKPKIVKGRGHVTAEKDDRASNSLPSVKKASPSPTKTSPAGNTAGKVKRSGSAPAGRPRRPEKDDATSASTSTPSRPTAFSSGPSTRGGTRKAKTSTGPSTRGGARKSSVGTAGGGSASRDGKRPEAPGLVKTIRQKIRNGLGLGKSDGFSLDIKKYRKK